MDAVGSINFNQPTANPGNATGTGAAKASATQAGQSAGFQAEAASLEISVKMSYVQLIGGTGATGDTGQASNLQDLLQKLQQWVRDMFDQNGSQTDGTQSTGGTTQDPSQQVGPGGSQAPDAVSKRILDFVKGFYDGSSDRAQLLRDAVEKGFKEAEGDWGGKLPDISYQTMDLVRGGLDQLFGTTAQSPTGAGSGQTSSSPSSTPPQLPSIDVAA